MDKERIEKAWEEHTLCNPLIMDEYSLNERQMFVKGARWRIDNVWHYDLDKAKTRKKVLVLFTYNRVRMYNDIRDIKWLEDLFVCFAYVDDLLPERKEETK